MQLWQMRFVYERNVHAILLYYTVSSSSSGSRRRSVSTLNGIVELSVRLHICNRLSHDLELRSGSGTLSTHPRLEEIRNCIPFTYRSLRPAGKQCCGAQSKKPETHKPARPADAANSGNGSSPRGMQTWDILATTAVQGLVLESCFCSDPASGSSSI